MPEIYGYIKHGPGDHLDKLVLSERGKLVVQTSDRPRCPGVAVIVLDEVEVKTCGG
jgi:hypothetical protein